MIKLYFATPLETTWEGIRMVALNRPLTNGHNNVGSNFTPDNSDLPTTEFTFGAGVGTIGEYEIFAADPRFLVTSAVDEDDMSVDLITLSPEDKQTALEAWATANNIDLGAVDQEVIDNFLAASAISI